MDSRINDILDNDLAEAILHTTEDGILITDNSGLVVKYNRRFTELWRLPWELSEETTLDDFQDHMLGQLTDQQSFLNNLALYRNQPETKGFETLYLKDGRVYEQFSQPMYRNGEVTAQVWSFRDFTLAERLQKELYKETSFRVAILNTLPDLIWLKDTQGVYLACNDRFEDFFGAKEIEIIGKSDYDFVDSELADFFRAHDKKSMEKGGPSVNEEWISFANDGHKELLETTKTPLYDHQKKLIGILGIGHDITERRAAEERLRESEERLSLAMRGTNDGLWDWNLVNDEAYYSPRWKEMLGYQNDELPNHLETWKQLVHAEDRDRVLKEVTDYINGSSDSLEIEMRMHHKAGHDVHVLSRAIRLFQEPDGKPVRLVGTHVDITERKRVERHDERNAEILEMIAIGRPAAEIYDAIALMYEARHPGMRCSLLELHKGRLLHGGAPSMPKAYCDAVHGLEFGPDIGSCGTSTYTGHRVIVENIETDPKWATIKDAALPHGMRCCWSEPIKSSTGKVLGAFGMYYDYPATPNEEESNDLKAAARLASIVMERDQNQKRIHQLAYTDELTGLASRPHFFQSLDELIKTSKRHQRRFSLLYIDLDNFKNVNDTLGHDVGDQLLKVIAKRLKKFGRDVDFVARLSGDEFCILMDDVSDDYITANLAKRCLELIAQPLELSSRWHTPACSIGIAHYPDDGTDASQLLKAADTSLYAAKEHGKNRFAFYNQELTRKAEYRFQFEQYLREAIESEQLTLVYQPQLHLATGQIIGVEALSRWHHPVMGQVPPTEFIQVAEQIGMIKPLTKTILCNACRQAVSWQQQGLPLLRMSVNISPSHFLDEQLVTLIDQVLEETEMDPTLLELEVTETAVQTDRKNIAIFSHLKESGIQIAIDDFGTGYSSIASLKHLKVDSLKIDKYFINDMLLDKKTQYLVNTMIEMGHNLGHTIVAEGIETKAQLELLKRLNCDTAQGYLFSRPVSAEAIPKLVVNGIPT
ncbi:bifunctional diguanylate cyclase/phosphodiesterase [Candidatus Thiodiazotropha endoloripes]|uniref:bifunctional diguanylate cyclase/phosphodiesterase n=1 Tax=Candidatus Thiodiazotropha endoloripes TaxID=1818881 RepID=UPI000903A36F|nr:bifunctional diguanylate cyclase/phosphodiesterase [Candidatus Thiodiazotropha endoloripes]